MVGYVKLKAARRGDADGEKPYVARITGLDSKFGLVREFLPRTVLVTDPGIYEVVSYNYGEKIPTMVVVMVGPPLNQLIDYAVSEEAVVEILRSRRPLSDLEPVRKWHGWCVCKNGKALWKSPPDVDTLKDERRRLMARIAEIDQAIAASASAPGNRSLSQGDPIAGLVAH